MIHRSAHVVPRTAASRRLSSGSRGILTPHRSMSIMPQFFPPSPLFNNINGPSGEFSSLFRLLDDYTYHVARRFDDSFSGLISNVTADFAPKFDIHETEEDYHLDGEVPGIEKDGLQIEFVDEKTLQIKGRTERNFSTGTPATEDADVTMTGAAIESDAPNKDSMQKETFSEPAIAEGTETTKSATPSTTENIHNGRYWVTERSVGEFSRTFSFPTPINQEAVKASLKNGVLSITVPKKTTEEAAVRRVTIE